MVISKSDFSSELFSRPGAPETAAVKIKARHYRLLKQYAAIIAFVVISLTATIVLLTLEISEIKAERQVYHKQIEALKSMIPPPQDTTEEVKYIQEIEGKLAKINNYLTKRGIAGFSMDNIGGNYGKSENLSKEETLSFYSQRLEDILIGVAFTPIGYPSNFIMNSGFGYRGDPFRKRGGVEFHPGIDFKGRKGDPVKTTADGKVIMAGWYQGYGNCVRIKHRNNLETLYGHLSKITVKKGQMVSTGQIIGKVGSTGNSTGNHLHYEVRKNGKPINPKKYLSLNY